MAAHSVATTGLQPDPLQCSVALPYRGEFYPLGFPARIASNSRAVLKAAGEAWGGTPNRFMELPLEIRCLVSDASPVARASVSSVRAQRNLLTLVMDAANFACCDLLRGFGSIWVTGDVLDDVEYFRYHFLEAVTYSLLDTLHVLTVHAACVCFQGRGVLLAGSPGAGKSSLAYACARRGWTFTSDDSSALIRREGGRAVAGHPRVFRFRGSARELFPEFNGLNEHRRGNGEMGIEVKTEKMPGIRTAPVSNADYIVFLDRHSGTGAAPELVSVPGEATLARLSYDPWPVELPGKRERETALRRLCSAEAFELRYRDLDGAVDLLEQLVRGGTR